MGTDRKESRAGLFCLGHSTRFRDREPAIQALDLVLEHGGFNEDETEAIRSKFSLTTLRRVIEDKSALTLLGLTVKEGQLRTTLTGAELIKPLKKVIRDIAAKAVNSRTFNKSEDIVKYFNRFEKADRADTSKKLAERPVEGIQKGEFSARAPKPANPRPKPVVEWPHVVPKNCSLNVTDNRIGEIYRELQTLKLTDARNGIAVLLRVFLEMSIDHFLETNGGSLKFIAPGGQSRFKTLDKKLSEVVGMLVSTGVPEAHFAAVTRSLHVKSNPMNIDLFHLYVHDRFATPSPQELTAAWNNAQPLFEKIWP